MRNWIKAETADPEKKHVAVVHCKAGKGRSGTVACSYLISQEGWDREDALGRFTLKRMRSGFGAGVSIPSQLRWVRYVDRWTNQMSKQYIEKSVEIVEIQVYGLRDGVKVCVEGYIEEGRRIQNFHTFTRDEKTVINEDAEDDPSTRAPDIKKQDTETLVSPHEGTPTNPSDNAADSASVTKQDVILKASSPILLETSDVNIDFERRNKAGYTGFTMVTAIAHVWFNAFFEGGYDGHNSGVFEIEWDAMDGIKGSERKGTKALDRLKVVWRYADGAKATNIQEPKLGEPIHESKPADWRGNSDADKIVETKNSEGVGSGRGTGGAALTLGQMTGEATSMLLGKDLGMRKSLSESANVSRASSIGRSASPSSVNKTKADTSDHELEGVKSNTSAEGDSPDNGKPLTSNVNDGVSREDTQTGRNLEAAMTMVSNLISKVGSKRGRSPAPKASASGNSDAVEQDGVSKP